MGVSAVIRPYLCVAVSTYDGSVTDDSVTDEVTAVPGTGRIVGQDWSLRAERMETAEGFDHD